jgi:hypothetical protein
MLRAAGWLVAAVLAGATPYRAALAFGAGSVGPQPGDDVAGSGAVGAIAFVAMVVGAAVAALSTVRPQRAVALLAPAAGAYLLAFYFTYDPYYAPVRRRYSEGAVSLGWILLVVALALVAGVTARFRPRDGSLATGAALLLVIVATALAGDGH